MSSSAIQLFQHCVVSMLVGASVACLNDIVHSFIELIKKKCKAVGIILFFKDLGITLTFTLCYILILFYCNGGKVRLIYLTMMLLGVLAHQCLASRIIRKVFMAILNTILGCIRIICLPITKIIKLILKIIRKFFYFWAQPLAKLKLRLYNRFSRIKLASAHGVTDTSDSKKRSN